MVAAYAVALVIEIARFWFRGSVRPGVVLGFAGTGWLLHTGLLIERVVSADALPLSSSYDWYLLASWALAGVFLYLTFYYPSRCDRVVLVAAGAGPGRGSAVRRPRAVRHSPRRAGLGPDPRRVPAAWAPSPC